MENKFTNKILKTFLSFSLAFFMSLFSFQGFAQCTSGLGANQEGFETAGANFFKVHGHHGALTSSSLQVLMLGDLSVGQQIIWYWPTGPRRKLLCLL